jgi:hypothetical protein
MTQRENLSCVHEPFGDAFYYGPERLSERYENDPEGREQSGFANTTYADVLRAIDESSEEVSLTILPLQYFILRLGVGGCFGLLELGAGVRRASVEHASSPAGPGQLAIASDELHEPAKPRPATPCKSFVEQHRTLSTRARDHFEALALENLAMHLF